MSRHRPKLTWTECKEDANRPLCNTELDALDELSKVVVSVGEWDSKSSGSFAKFFKNRFWPLLSESWLRDFMLIPLPRGKSSSVNYIVDAALLRENCQCGSVHQVRVEISFDNRQIIGTNVLKMILDQELVLSKENYTNLGVLICASREAKTTFELDPAVGSSDEYLMAIETGYTAFVSTPIFLGVIRGK